MNVRQFIPKKSKEAQSQFEDFIDHYKKIFSDYIYDEDGNIDMSISYRIPDSMAAKSVGRNYANIRKVKGHRETDLKCQFYQSENWVCFIKILNLVRVFKNKKSNKQISYAFEALFDVAECYFEPWQLNTKIFTNAAKLNTSVNVDMELHGLVKFININLLTEYPILFERTIFRDVKQEIEAREKHLPCLQSCEFLADGFLASKRSLDIEAVCAFALLNYSPTRISEIALLRKDCLIDEPELGVAIRYDDVAKNGKPDISYSPCDEFSTLAKISIEKLLKSGDKARLAAKWYEKNPDELYIPAELKHLRSRKFFNVEEVHAIVGLSSENLDDLTYMERNVRYWIKIKTLNRLFVEAQTGKKAKGRLFFGRNYKISRSDLFEWVKSKLPKQMPYADARKTLLLSDALFCSGLRWNRVATDFIPAYRSGEALMVNIGCYFERHGRDDLSLSTHQIRHLLNTIAQSRHLDQRLIALWSKRLSVSQNESYDHTSPLDNVEAITHKLSDNEYKFGGFLKEIFEEERNAHRFITPGEFYKNITGNMHVTRIGVCKLPMYAGPCSKIGECIDCDEHCFIRGDIKSRTEVIKIIDRLEPVVIAAKEAVERNECGASDFHEKNNKKLQRYKDQIKIQSDIEIADDALCALPPSDNRENIITRSLKIRDSNHVTTSTKQSLSYRFESYAENSGIEFIKKTINGWNLSADGLPHIDAISVKVSELISVNKNSIHRALVHQPELRILIDDLRKRFDDVIKVDLYGRCSWRIEYFIFQTCVRLKNENKTITLIDELYKEVIIDLEATFPAAYFSNSALRSYWPEFKIHNTELAKNILRPKA